MATRHVSKNCLYCGREFTTRKASCCSMRCAQLWRHHDRTTMQLFLEKVQRADPPACWLWLGGKNGGGYGRMNFGGRYRLAHRVSHELFNGPVPDDMCVLHKCDNPPCVNPAHLFVGTKKDNVDDMIRKGRKAIFKSADHPMARLTEAQVISIRADTRTQVAIAREYGLTQAAISRIKLRLTWRDLQPNH